MKPIQPGELCVVLRWNPADSECFQRNVGIFVRAVAHRSNYVNSRGAVDLCWEFAEASRPLCIARHMLTGELICVASTDEAQARLPHLGRPGIPTRFLLPIRDPDQGVDQEERHDLPATV